MLKGSTGVGVSIEQFVNCGGININSVSESVYLQR